MKRGRVSIKVKRMKKQEPKLVRINVDPKKTNQTREEGYVKTFVTDQEPSILQW